MAARDSLPRPLPSSLGPLKEKYRRLQLSDAGALFVNAIAQVAVAVVVVTNALFFKVPK